VRGLLCDALAAVLRALTAPLRKVISDAIADARDRATREDIAAALVSATWTAKDDEAFDQAFGEYLQEPE
jgi:hypothetical protein